MIGYHYTSEANWQGIRKDGLHPYRLREDIVPDGVPGIWMFTKRQRGQSHAGCILFQIRSKHTLHVVELAVSVDETYLRREHWENYIVLHDGQILDDKNAVIDYYHRGATAMISWRHIPPERIKMIGEYRFSDAWAQTDEYLTVSLLEQAMIEKVAR